jgi:hypothetical protein
MALSESQQREFVQLLHVARVYLDPADPEGEDDAADECGRS